MIAVDNLSKRYGDKLAVDGLSFVVQPGMVTGFLGPNGAGKSTTMRIIAGLDEPTHGRVVVNGGDYRSAAAPMAELGVLLEAKAVHTGRSARNHLLALAQTNGISRKRVDTVIDIVGLREVAGKRVGGFSLGMGQRLGVASALLGSPQTMVLDEPVNGLDPEPVRWMRTMLQDLAADGHTVFVSSHLMSEMAQTATRLVVIGRGRLLADTTVAEFVARASQHSVTVRTPEAVRLRELLLGPDITVTTDRPDLLGVDGLTAEHRHHCLAGPHAHLRADGPAGLPGGRLHDNDQRLRGIPLHQHHGHHRRHRHTGRHRGDDAMTAASVAPPTSASVGRGATLRVTQLRVVLSEWTKFRSLRSTLYTLLLAVVFMIGLGALFSAITANQPGGLEPGQSAISTSLTGTFFAQLAVGVLGVLLITGEYSTGMIRASLTVVPKRLPMLWAKLGVFAGVVFLTMLLASVTSFFVGQALLSGHNLNASLSDPGALRSVVGASLYLTVAGMTALALGALLRNTAAAVTTFVAVFFVIPPLTNLLPRSLTDHFVQYLPSNAGAVMLDGTYGVAHALQPWTGFAVMSAYAVVLIGAAAWRLRHVDA